MRQHNRRNQQFTWRQVDLMEGAVGEWTPTSNADHATSTPAGRNRTIRHLNEDESGTISIPIYVASQTYRDLRVLQKTDKQAENVIGVGIFKDTNIGMTVYYKNMSIQNIPPPPGGGVEAAQVTCVFAYESIEDTLPSQVPTVGQ